MSNYLPTARLLYVPAAVTITASGDSGATLIDLREVLDVALVVTIASTPAGTAPTLVVGLDVTDDQGNWVTQVIKTASLNAAGSVLVSGGLHGATPVVLPAHGRVSWTIGGTGGPSFPGVQIALFGR